MKTVNVPEAEANLWELLSQVEHGEEIVITRNGIPVARLVGIQPRIRREPGILRRDPGWTDFVYDRSLFAPMTDREMKAEGWPA